MKNHPTYLKKLDLLLEGIQIIDFNWRYVYLNNVMSKQIKTEKENLLGFTVMEIYPGIEKTELFEHLQKCMEDRTPIRFENKFTFPDDSVKWFDLSIGPDDEGICIFSLDITKHKKREAKIIKIKNLYAFLSQINQSIVHIKSEPELFKRACKIAIKFGKFKMGWVGIFDENYQNIKLVEKCGMKKYDLTHFKNISISQSSTIRKVLETKSYYVSNDIKTIEGEILQSYLLENEIESIAILPLFKQDKLIGTFSIYSHQNEFFGEDDIKLLQEVAYDISFAIGIYEKDRKHLETELLVVENEKRFRALIEKSTDMKTLADINGKLFYGSPSITKTLGYDLDLMKLTSLFDFLHPDDINDYSLQRAQSINIPGESFKFEMRMRHANGSWIWIEGSTTNLLEESGVNAMVSNFRDITEKKINEQQREFDRKNLNALINNTNDLLWSVDNNLNLITANRPFNKFYTKLTGTKIKKGEMILQDTLTEERTAILKKLYNRALKGKVFSKIVSFSSIDEEWTEISFFPIKNNLKIVGVACHSRDITETILARKLLENQNKELIKTNFELDRFVYSVSHDLRSPLTSILGLLSLMEEESPDTMTLMHINLIRGRITQLDNFIRNILNYSKNKRTNLENEKINLNKIVSQVIESLHGHKELKYIRFENNVPDSINLWTDFQSLLTILENLLTNAIKFHNPNQDDTYVKINAVNEGEIVKLTIEDNGKGISDTHQKFIFDMFYRISAQVEGTGIGLYVVKEIIEKLGGTITVSSQENIGTTFLITLKNANHGK